MLKTAGARVREWLPGDEEAMEEDDAEGSGRDGGAISGA